MSKPGSKDGSGDKALDEDLNSDLFDYVRRTGDWDLLAGYIEDGGAISNEIRMYLVGILRGETRSNNRPSKAQTLFWHRMIANFVLKREAGGVRPEAAIREACDCFGIDRRTVQRARKKWREQLGRAG